MTHAGGAPTKYDSLYIQKIEEYLTTCGREQTKLPKREDVASILDVDEDTLNNWGKEHPEFFGALKKIDRLQKAELMDDGLFGGKEVNPGMAIFLLKANHGLIETTRTELGGVNGQPIQIIAGRGFVPPNTKIETEEIKLIENE